jgi:hypothetical protein
VKGLKKENLDNVLQYALRADTQTSSGRTTNYTRILISLN